MGPERAELHPGSALDQRSHAAGKEPAGDPAEGAARLNLDWRRYDTYFKAGKNKQKPMKLAEKSAIERFAARTLGIASPDADRCWGEAHPPGCFAQTVIRVGAGVRHDFSGRGLPVCLKINNAQRGMSQWDRLHRFHTQYRDKLPGLPKGNVQQVLAIGPKDLANGDRPYIVQEWVEGKTLEAIIEAGASVTGDDVLRILDALFLKLVIPAWSQGTKWWDARRSNYVFTPDNRLVMIDPDVLADYGEEIVTTPQKFTQRNTCNPDLAIARYETLIIDLALACAEPETQRGLKGSLRKLCTENLDPLFRKTNCRYPLAPDWKEKATEAYLAFRRAYAPLLTPAGQTRSTPAPRLKPSKNAST